MEGKDLLLFSLFQHPCELDEDMAETTKKGFRLGLGKWLKASNLFDSTTRVLRKKIETSAAAVMAWLSDL